MAATVTAPVQTAPEAADRFYASGQHLIGSLILDVRSLWRQFDARNIDGSVLAITGQATARIAAAQIGAASQAQAYVSDVLDELDVDGGEPQATLRPAAFAVSASGLPLEDTVATVRLRALHAAAQGLSPSKAGLGLLERIAETQVTSAARQATSTAMAVRPKVTGWVRMLNPGACSRCIVLAGKFYRWNQGFQRHPRCKCRHIPATEDVGGDYLTDPDAYFASLSADEQAHAFTAAGAQAIRDGADIGQVVNARLGIERTQMFGRSMQTTTVGTTARSTYGRAQRDLAKVQGERYRRTRTPRLLPESIYEIANDRQDAIRLLRFYGYTT